MKNIYKDFNNIGVDINKINSINTELDDITKQRVKNNIKNSIKPKNLKHKRILKTLIASSIAALILFFSIIPKTSIIAFAENLPILNSIFEKFNDRYEGDFKDYTQAIGESKTDQGYTVTLNEVVMDDYSLMIVYTIKYPEKISELPKNEPLLTSASQSILIDGKIDLNAGSGGLSKTIDEYTVQEFVDYDFNNTNIPKNFNMKIDTKEINGVKGNWSFELNISKEKISKNTKTFSTKKPIKIPDVEEKESKLSFEKVSFSPISTAIILKSTGKINFDEPELKIFNPTKLIFKDEKGQIIERNSLSSSPDSNNPTSYIHIYKFKHLAQIPKKIIVEYPDKNTKNTIKTELVLK